MTLPELRAQYERGTLPRDEFWFAAQREYRRLREKSPLPPNGAIRGIHAEGERLIVELRDGLRMYWNPDDLRTAPNMLLNHGEYESHELEILLREAKNATVIFDIGANIGWYTLHLARAIAPRGGRVVAFEPIPRTFAALRDNVRLNDIEGVATLRNVGLGERAGEVEFYLPAVTGSVAASQRPLFEAQANEKIRARIERLDDVVRDLGVDRLDLLKCDIEGGELLMLRGGLETIRRFKPVLFLELLRKWSKAFGYHPNDVITLLAAEGYQCFAIADSGLRPIEAIDDAVVETNFLFRPRA